MVQSISSLARSSSPLGPPAMPVNRALANKPLRASVPPVDGRLETTFHFLREGVMVSTPPLFSMVREGLDALATVWVFDEHNAFSQSTLPAINSGLKDINVLSDLLMPGLVEYLDLPGIVVGEIDSSSPPLVASDVGMRIFDDAMVVVPWSEGHKYTVAVYFEPVISSLGLDIQLGADRDTLTGGFEESLRPRVAIAIDSTHASEILAIDKELAQRHDWARQHDAWATMAVASNLAESNGPAVAYNNGLLWLRYLGNAGMPALDRVSVLYVVEALGWFVQASAEGGR